MSEDTSFKEYGDKLISLGNKFKDGSSTMDDIVKSCFELGLMIAFRIEPIEEGSVEIKTEVPSKDSLEKARSEMVNQLELEHNGNILPTDRHLFTKCRDLLKLTTTLVRYDGLCYNVNQFKDSVNELLPLLSERLKVEL